MKNDFVFFDSYVCIFISIRQIYSWKQKQLTCCQKQHIYRKHRQHLIKPGQM